MRLRDRPSPPAALLAAALAALLLGACATIAPGERPARDPVVLVAGLGAPAFAYEILAARLRSDGYPVWIYRLPWLGFCDMAEQAADLAVYVADLRARSGADRVDLVAHSQGGLVARYYLERLGGTQAVGSYVSLGTPQYGTAWFNLLSGLSLGTCLGLAPCRQMKIGSSFLGELNAGDDTPGSVRYAAIASWTDELAQPAGRAFLSGADGPALRIGIQERCWLRVVGHVGLILDGAVYSAVRQALEGRSEVRLDCFAL